MQREGKVKSQGCRRICDGCFCGSLAAYHRFSTMRAGGYIYSKKQRSVWSPYKYGFFGCSFARARVCHLAPYSGSRRLNDISILLLVENLLLVCNTHNQVRATITYMLINLLSPSGPQTLCGLQPVLALSQPLVSALTESREHKLLSIL